MTTQKKQPKQDDSHADWLPVQVTDEYEPKGSIIIHLDQFSVEVQPGADVQLLAEVVRVLQS